jgi:hypothetical protein
MHCATGDSCGRAQLRSSQAAAAAACVLQLRSSSVALCHSRQRVCKRHLLPNIPSAESRHQRSCAMYSSFIQIPTLGPRLSSRVPAASLAASLPVVCFCCACRQRRTAAGKLWGASMLGVCGGSITFHVSSGKWRDLGRKLDYW